MAEGKEEKKFDFTAEGEELGHFTNEYLSLRVESPFI
jgi:hypothetical protein